MFSVPTNDPEPMYDDMFSVYPPSLTKDELQYAVVTERLHLYNNMKPCGAGALRKRLQSLGVVKLPSISTIGRILSEKYLTHRRTGYYPGDYQCLKNGDNAILRSFLQDRHSVTPFAYGDPSLRCRHRNIVSQKHRKKISHRRKKLRI
jgi:hypothetical protein